MEGDPKDLEKETKVQEMQLAEPKVKESIGNKDANIDRTFLPKHPLQNQWKLWYIKYDKNKCWEDNMKQIASFDNVEDFWALFNHVVKPSDLKAGCDYCLFKDNISPMWEDDQNKRGGRWLLQLTKERRKSLDALWLETLFCLIGEMFGDNGDDICGAYIQIRSKADKLAIWTTDATHKDRILGIGRLFKEKLFPGSAHDKPPLVYESHVATSSKTGSTARHMYKI